MVTAAEHVTQQAASERLTWKRLAEDPQFRAEMAVCEAYRIPHSQLLGGSGVWTDLDRIKALAHQVWQRMACTGCGTRASEWEADRFAYVVDVRRCPGCEAIELEQEQIPENQKGLRLGLVPRELAEASGG